MYMRLIWLQNADVKQLKSVCTIQDEELKRGLTIVFSCSVYTAILSALLYVKKRILFIDKDKK